MCFGSGVTTMSMFHNVSIHDLGGATGARKTITSCTG